MGLVAFYRDQIVPRFIDKACAGPELREWRDRAAAGLAGTVVELGFGSALNVGSYPPEVTEVLAVEPSIVGRRLGQKRIADVSVPVTFVGLRGETLSLPDDSCDGALCTFTLCTIDGVDQALAELRRVLRPGGRFHFLEHGSAPDPGVQRWQRRLEPFQLVLADGCHLTRDPVTLVSDAGFRVEESESRYTPGPKPWTFFTLGRAVNPD